jgi:glycosyltransferase involved in cell wall biosynthesis
MPRLLFIAPVVPAATGNGLAMRAGMFLDAFSRAHEVSLLVVPVSGAADPRDVPEFVSRRTARVVVLPPDECLDPWFGLIARLTDAEQRRAALEAYPHPALCRLGPPHAVGAAAARLAGTAFDVVHVFRLYLAPFAEPFLASRPPGHRPAIVLDLDEDEWRTRRRLAAVYALRGDAVRARQEASEAEKYERLAELWLSRFDRVLVCAPPDAAELQRRLDVGAVEIVPNAVDVPAVVSRRACADGAFTLLFVGTLGYFPNEDAIRFFCDAILPALRARVDRAVRVEIVGGGAPAAVRALAEIPGVMVRGQVPDLEPFYAAADVAVAPLRAGGGTRIKILEAFAHGVPVVSTSTGAEGLDVASGRHLLLADDAGGFAAACGRLAREPGLAAGLAERARALVLARHARPSVAATIERVIVDCTRSLR